MILDQAQNKFSLILSLFNCYRLREKIHSQAQSHTLRFRSIFFELLILHKSAFGVSAESAAEHYEFTARSRKFVKVNIAVMV